MHYQREQVVAKRGRTTAMPDRQVKTPIAPRDGDSKILRLRRSGKAKTTADVGNRCAHPRCDKAPFKKGMCGKHFMEWVRTQRRGAGQS